MDKKFRDIFRYRYLFFLKLLFQIQDRLLFDDILIRNMKKNNYYHFIYLYFKKITIYLFFQ